MELPSALEEIILMDGVDPYTYPYPYPHPTPDNGHIHLEDAAGNLCLEDDMLAVYEAFYPNSSITTTSPNDHGLMAAYPSLPPADISSHQLPVLQAQQQFQPHHHSNHYWQQQQQQQQIVPRKGTGIRKKKKTEQLKTVYRVPADNILTVDKWAWRKYGQKPIKGSPFPRNYYRCSSSKGCSARKQVERSLTEAEVYIVTYTGDHFHPWPLHRNALAGISRSDHHKNGSTTPQLQAPPPAPAPAPEGEALLIPNSKNVDEDTLSGMEQLAKWNRSHTSALAFY